MPQTKEPLNKIQQQKPCQKNSPVRNYQLAAVCNNSIYLEKPIRDLGAQEQVKRNAPRVKPPSLRELSMNHRDETSGHAAAGTIDSRKKTESARRRNSFAR